MAGKHGFRVQLNVGRVAKKRPTEFGVDLVVQPFDPNRFQFSKADQVKKKKDTERRKRWNMRGTMKKVKKRKKGMTKKWEREDQITYHLLLAPYILST